MSTLLILLLICLILLSAVVSAAETSLFSLSSFTIKTYKSDEDKRKKIIAKLLNRPRDLLVTILMINIIANISIQNTVSSIFGSFASWALKVGVPLFLTLFFGEIIPKSLALPNNKFIAYKLAPFLSFTTKIIKPIRILLIKVTSYISRVMFFFLKKEKPLTFDELEHVIRTSEEKKILSADETDLVEGYLHLHDSNIKEHLRPRSDVLFYDINDPIEILTNLFSEKQISRIPVCDNDIENILGVITLKRFFIHKDEIKMPSDLKKFLKKPFFVPDTIKSWNLLLKLRSTRENIAVVVDEYGSIEGIITQEDLTEPVIGEIFDVADSKLSYTMLEDGSIIASGQMQLEELEDIMNTPLERKTTAVTVGGFLTDEIGEIPIAGIKFVKNNLVFYILSSDPTRIRRVFIKLKKQPKKEKGKK
ncbi:MAG: HlyC/CorC family transporter [Parachlamydiales bacterium]|nr:HlyC/CorC family transporter [Parachlamydiales bacterium]